MHLRDRHRTPSQPAGAGWLRWYPRAWRERYEDEVLALLEAHPLRPSDRLDLVRGAIDAHLHPLLPSVVPAAAALLAGAGWTITAVGAAVQPAPPDWPGYLAGTLPTGVLAATAALFATAAPLLRGPDRRGRLAWLEWAVAIGGPSALVIALLVAFLGGPYGAVTGAALSGAGVATVLVGAIRWRAGDGSIGIGLLVAGVAMLIPNHLAWLLVGGSWTALGLWLLVDRAAGRRPGIV
jgi:hypothetical protein